ncbi:hypothetical protein EYB25_006965 [Talaromyces marneffei]|nr:hypothetical protein EYB25_006965 [Talaromyces marneffei]
MCQFIAYYHCACQHTDIQPVQMCPTLKIELARINESQAKSAASTIPFSPGLSCMPTFPAPGPGVQSNIAQYYVVRPDQVSPVVAAKRMRVEVLKQRAQNALYGQIGSQGRAVPYEQAYYQTAAWVAAQQQQTKLQYQTPSHNQSITIPRPPSPPIAGLCLHCTEAVGSVKAIQQAQPYYGLTEEEVMGAGTWRFVVESYRTAYELVNNWVECISAINPLAGRYASLDYPGFPFHLALPPYTPSPYSEMESMVEELNKEIMMRKMHTMIVENHEEVRAIKKRYAEEGSAYYENNPYRFVSHAAAEDPFTDDVELGDVPEIVHPLLHNQPQKGSFTAPKQRVSREVRDNVCVRENSNKSPTPAPRYLHGVSLLDVNLATSMDIDEGTDTDWFAFTDRNTDTDTDMTTDIDDDDGDTVVCPGSITDCSPMVMSGIPALTFDNTPSRTTITSISTPSTAPRPRKRIRIQESLPERWRSALRPRQHLRDDSMNGLYLD